MRKGWLVASAVVLGLAVVAVGQLREKPGAGERSGGLYRVTPWPDQTGAEKYRDEVEAHLNRLAADGWRFHSELVGQFGKLAFYH